MARQSVSKHLAILETANLVTTVRRGREKLHYLNAAPINEIGERWISRTTAIASVRSPTSSAHWRTPHGRSPSFVYTTYIQTTRNSCGRR